MEHDGLDAISHETIYQYIYADQRRGGKLYLSLRHKHRKYHKRSAEYQRRGQLKNRVSIDERPFIVEAKEYTATKNQDSDLKGHLPKCYNLQSI